MSRSWIIQQKLLLQIQQLVLPDKTSFCKYKSSICLTKPPFAIPKMDFPDKTSFCKYKSSICLTRAAFALDSQFVVLIPCHSYPLRMCQNLFYPQNLTWKPNKARISLYSKETLSSNTKHILRFLVIDIQRCNS